MKNFVIVALAVTMSAVQARAEDRVGVALMTGVVVNRGATKQTESSIQFSPAFARELELSFRLSRHWTVAASIVEAQPRVKLRTNGELIRGRVRAEPATIEFRYRFAGERARLRPFLGMGMVYPFFHPTSRAFDSSGRILRIDSTDHGAWSVTTGCEVSLSRHWGLIGKINYGPVRSTAEPIEASGDPLHADFHPLAATAGVMVRF